MIMMNFYFAVYECFLPIKWHPLEMPPGLPSLPPFLWKGCWCVLMPQGPSFASLGFLFTLTLFDFNFLKIIFKTSREELCMHLFCELLTSVLRISELTLYSPLETFNPRNKRTAFWTGTRWIKHSSECLEQVFYCLAKGFPKALVSLWTMKISWVDNTVAAGYKLSQMTTLHSSSQWTVEIVIGTKICTLARSHIKAQSIQSMENQ